MKLEHSAINVKDAKAVAQWWSEHLGMRIVMESDEPPFMHFLADDDGAMMEIYAMAEAEVPDWANIDPQSIHFAFTTKDMDAEQTRLEAGGAEVVAGRTSPAGDRLLFLRDPYGTPFQLVQRKQPLL